MSYSVLSKSHKDYIDMLLLLHARASTHTELANKLQFSTPKVSEMVKNLQDNEWIKVYPTPDHTKIIKITTKGNHALLALKILYDNKWAKELLYSIMEEDKHEN